MRILEIDATNGPNYWSVRRHKLIVMLLDLEEMEEHPTNTIPHFYDRLKTLLPSLYEHRCSEGRPGGFFERVMEGTWMGHVVEHVALELQTLAGMNTGFGRTRAAGGKGFYHVVFSYEDEAAGRYAAEAAVRLVESLIDNVIFDLTREINLLRVLWKENKLGPSTGKIAEEALNRKIPVMRLNDNSLLQLGYGSCQHRIEATVADTTSNIAVELAGDKAATKKMLEADGIPVPHGEIVYDEISLEEAVKEIGYPLAIKPVDGNHGNGASTDINNWQEAMEAFKAARHYSEAVICEKFINGHDFRALVVNYKFVAAALRTPAVITGNGKNTIRELIDIINVDPARGNGHEEVLTAIKLDEVTAMLLCKKGYTPDTVLAAGEVLYLKPTANLSTGGCATDVTDIVHADNVALFERIARIIGLDICGIDVIAEDLQTPLYKNGGAVLEVNAGPGLRMHLQPSAGQSRNVAVPIIDMLFPKGKGRIPIAAITGTNGKTTTARLLARMASMAGNRTGLTTTDGIYIDGRKIMEGDCSGPVSAQLVLRDPGVDFAVLECARGGILRKGLGFDYCDIGIITNIAEDHLGMKGIDTIEQLARVKGVVAEAVHQDGYAVLNADDDLVYAMKDRLDCGIALFSLNADNERIATHCAHGGLAAIYRDGYVCFAEGDKITKVQKVNNIPLTFGGAAEFNVANVLAAALAAYIQHIPLQVIIRTLQDFHPSHENTPGRMNVFDFGTFRMVIDYAHNAAGLTALRKFVQASNAASKVGIIAPVGDRREEDIIRLGAEAARTFDEIIIRHDKDLRGRQPEELNNLLLMGIENVNPSMAVKIIQCEKDAIDYAILHAVKDALIVLCSDDISAAIEQVLQSKEKKYEDSTSMSIY
jgi:cyanophycin synthetase